MSRAELLARHPELEGIWDDAHAAFPVRITRTFWSRTDPDDPDDPLARQVLPDARELDLHPDDLGDPVGDAARSPVPWVIHKYPDRVLWLLTKRCHLYCRYCFRRDHQPGEREDPTEDEWAAAAEYVRGSGAREVILSGGDPLAVPPRRLFEAIDAIRPQITVIRIHTRAPITFPDAITDALAAGLRERAPVWVVVHCNHPRELAPDVDAALARLVDAGIPVLNQAVLLRGVNDDAEVLVALCEALVARRVMPYYLHLTDRARGNAHLRVEPERAVALHDALHDRLGGIALPKLVVDPPDGSGKIDVRRWLERR